MSVVLNLNEKGESGMHPLIHGGVIAWGNSPGADLLQLEKNEAAKRPDVMELLLAGFCDLRHVLTTLAAVTTARKPPAQVKFELVDINPSAVSRTLVLLCILADLLADKENTSLKNLFVDVWLSTGLTEDQHNTTKIYLKEIIDGKRSYASLSTGNLEVSGPELSDLWPLATWSDATPVPFEEIVKAKLETRVNAGIKPDFEILDLYMTMPREICASVDETIRTGALQTEPVKWANTLVLADGKQFLGPPKGESIEVFDIRAVAKTKAWPDFRPAFRSHVVALLESTIQAIQSGLKVSFQLRVEDVKEAKFRSEAYDRVHISNLQDYWGLPRTLEIFPATLLNPKNPHAVLLLDLQNWIEPFSDPAFREDCASELVARYHFKKKKLKLKDITRAKLAQEIIRQKQIYTREFRRHQSIDTLDHFFQDLDLDAFEYTILKNNSQLANQKLFPFESQGFVFRRPRLNKIFVWDPSGLAQPDYCPGGQMEAHLELTRSTN